MGEETRAAARAVETLERKDRILIVEDEDNARKGYEQLLQRWGYDVLGVGSAEEVLAKFAGYQPDTLIADVELPGMSVSGWYPANLARDRKSTRLNSSHVASSYA